jgi:streptogramin lyase
MSAEALAHTLRYEVVEEWGSLPDEVTLGQTGIATDSNDNVYLFNRGSHPLIVLDPEGGYVTSFLDSRLTDAHGIFIDAADRVYLPVKNAHLVLVLTRDGTTVRTLGERDVPSDTGYSGRFGDPLARSAGPFNRPTDVAVGPNGDIYVSDGYGNARVHRFSADGDLLQSWGEPGAAPGQFAVPHAIWAHSDGRVFVADRENNRIQIFTSSGEFLSAWTGLHRPSDIYIDDDGLVFVAELDSLFAVFTDGGELVMRTGTPSDTEPMRGGHQIWGDSRGDLYVGQNREGHRLLKFHRL